MSQFGMQMPGGGGQRRAQPNVYTALLFFAVVCLAGACFFMWRAATEVSPATGAAAPFTLQQPNQIRLSGQR